ncbi:ATP synthase F0 subunit A [Aestuariibacter salexigens]|uniref:DUF350 domain-containing protein n=1 Tax=Aestuariibacter salexigens TaxID=226010 RepID=UPI000415E33F|nr:ATP synthase F0 subunit A [Aestuariibacter salexigens]
MQSLVNLTDLSFQLWIYLAIDVVVALCLLFSVRWMAGKMSHVSISEELSVKDNVAFGISIAGRMLSLCIVLAGAAGRQMEKGYGEAIISMVLFGIVGIFLVRVGRVAHDKLILHQLDKEAVLRERGTSVAVVDASSAVASAIIINSIMIWTTGTDTNAIVAIISGFLVVHAILLITTRLIERRFAASNQNGSMQDALCKGQLALSIEHSGNLIGTAIIVSAASSLLVYQPAGYVSNITGWLIVGVALTLLLKALQIIGKRIVLFRLNWREEVYQQDNVGVASLLWVMSVGLALIISGLL